VQPTFSILITAYQAAEYISDAIESVLTQTRSPQEIIIVDDGSTDDLPGALKAYRTEVTLLRTEHRGASAAYNVGMRAATAEFVSVLDADDVFLPDYLRRVSELAMLRPDLDILTTNAYLEIDGRIIGSYYPRIARFVVGDQRAGVLHNHFIFGLASIRRESLLAVGGRDEHMTRGGDAECFTKLILNGSRAGLIDEPLARYRLRPGSLSADRAESMRTELAIVERARGHPTLTATERQWIDHELSIKRTEVALALAESSLRTPGPGARGRALRTALGRGFGPRTRTNLLVGALWPRAGARLFTLPGGHSTLHDELRGR
jgi:hypothetical protein